MEDANEGTTAREVWRRRTEALRALGEDRAGAWDEALRLFGNERDLVLAVHQRWQVNLLARLDQVLEDGGEDPHADVLRAVAELSRALPGFAAVLTAHDDDPALDRARRRLADYVDRACPCGRPHPLVGAPAPRRAPTRCVVVRRARALAAGLRRRSATRPDGGPFRARLIARAV